MPPRRRFYGVRSGRATGVYDSWAECEVRERMVERRRWCGGWARGARRPAPPSFQSSVRGYSSASFRGFATRDEAAAFAAGDEGEAAPAPKAKKRRTRAPSPPPPPPSYTGPLADPDARYTLFFDGACRGNHVPGGGVAGVGAVVRLESAPGAPPGPELGRVCALFTPADGTAPTNNTAEWAALEAGVRGALAAGVTRLAARGDSQLVVRQATGEYAAKSPPLAAARDRVRALAAGLKEWEIAHVFREANAVADGLANDALDGRGWNGLRGGGAGEGVGEEAAGASSPTAPRPPPTLPTRRPGPAFFDWAAGAAPRGRPPAPPAAVLRGARAAPARPRARAPRPPSRLAHALAALRPALRVARWAL